MSVNMSDIEADWAAIESAWHALEVEEQAQLLADDVSYLAWLDQINMLHTLEQFDGTERTN